MSELATCTRCGQVEVMTEAAFRKRILRSTESLCEACRSIKGRWSEEDHNNFWLFVKKELQK